MSGILNAMQSAQMGQRLQLSIGGCAWQRGVVDRGLVYAHVAVIDPCQPAHDTGLRDRTPMNL